ncbi:hypothetical protein ACRAKI_21575 [Saccharothrix isguenensis]
MRTMTDAGMARSRLWGRVVELRGFPDAELAEVHDTFAGSVSPAGPGEEPELLVERRYVTVPVELVEQRPRHRGGSSARKFFLDASPFHAGEQHRDIDVCVDGEGREVYRATGPAGDAVVLAADGHVSLSAEGLLPPMLLADVLEDWLLCRARAVPSVQVHCAAWLDDGVSTLVVGSSGVGKTTELFRHLAGGSAFLSNDRAFLRMGEHGVEVCGFPLPVNVGCGTIRSLGLDLPDHGLDDHDKIRLRAPEVVERFGADYETWFPVARVVCASLADLEDNVYWTEDDCHPFWIASWRPGPVIGDVRDRLRDALAPLITEAAPVLS